MSIEVLRKLKLEILRAEAEEYHPKVIADFAKQELDESGIELCATTEDTLIPRVFWTNSGAKFLDNEHLTTVLVKLPPVDGEVSKYQFRCGFGSPEAVAVNGMVLEDEELNFKTKGDFRWH